MPTSREITFKRLGRSYQLDVRSADDLPNVLDLDEAHWVAASAATAMITCDPVFLDLVDVDHNGRILCYEMKHAIRWLLDMLRDFSGVNNGSDTLHLGAVNTDDDEGRRIVESAKKILIRQGRSTSDDVTLEQVRAVKTQVESTAISEAGVILPHAAQRPEITQFLTDIINTVGGVPHPSGAAGINSAKLDEFLAQARAYLDWKASGEPAEDDPRRSELLSLGPATAKACNVMRSLRDKLDQYFAQCMMLAFDTRSAQALDARMGQFDGLDFSDPSAMETFLENAPLARPRADRLCPLDESVNLHYAPLLKQFLEHVVKPILGTVPDMLSEAQWQQIKRTFASYEAWLDAKPSQAVEPLGEDKLSSYLQPPCAQAVSTLIAESATTAFVLDNIRLVEKLILYQMWMLKLVNNFVSFPFLYDEHTRAMFEMGTLIMDGRRFDLSVKVDDRQRHIKIAERSNMYVLYVQLTRKDAETHEVAVPVTSGNKGNLYVGKRGIFQDVNGREWDAEIVHVIENPISIVETLVSPFQRLGQLITGKIESVGKMAEKKLDQVVTADTAAASSPAAPRTSPGNLIMGGGVAVAALGSATAFITKTFAALENRYVALYVLIGIVLAILLPTAIVAIVKLRGRDLSAILAGSGWAINARMRLTGKQGRCFTRYPVPPKSLTRLRWLRRAIIVIIIAAVTVGIVLTRRYIIADTNRSAAPSAVSAP